MLSIQITILKERGSHKRKHTLLRLVEIEQELLRKVKTAASIAQERLRNRPAQLEEAVREPVDVPVPGLVGKLDLIVIGASTGGPPTAGRRSWS